MKTAKSPALPFYGKQFYDDESVWLSSLAHQGLYIALLWHEWANGSIPSDVALIARLVGQREPEVRRLWDDVSRYFAPQTETGDRLINAPLEAIRSQMVTVREKRSNSGSKGGSKTQANLQAKINLPYGDGEANTPFQNDDELDSAFAEIWKLYPRKLGRDDARRHFGDQVSTRGEAAAVRSAVVNYCRDLEIVGRDDKHTLHGSTFFHGKWRDYVDGVWTPPRVSAKVQTTHRSALVPQIGAGPQRTHPTADEAQDIATALRQPDWPNTDCTREQGAGWLKHIREDCGGDLSKAQRLADWLKERKTA